MSLDYLDFDLTITTIDATQGVYQARVLNAPLGQAETEFTLPFAPVELENYILKMGRPRRGVRSRNSQEGQAALDLGRTLYEAVFSGPVQAALLRSLDDADSAGQGLRIRLRLNDAPALSDIPWEFLYETALNRFLAQSVNTPVVRYLDLPQRIRPLSVEPPLRILVMIASPGDLEPLDIQGEWVKVQAATADLAARGLVQVDRLPRATLSALQRHLRRDHYHIVHFIGHGGFDRQTAQSVLMLESEMEPGRSRLVSGHQLGALLHDHRSLRLCLLNACEGARVGQHDPFSGVAQHLVRQGIPAVIAMQFEITDDAAKILAHEFYGALADGFPVDGALGEARKAIYIRGNDVEWGTPVLYMRASDGRLFDVAEFETQRAELGRENAKSVAYRVGEPTVAHETPTANGAQLPSRGIDDEDTSTDKLARVRSRGGTLPSMTAASRARGRPTSWFVSGGMALLLVAFVAIAWGYGKGIFNGLIDSAGNTPVSQPSTVAGTPPDAVASTTGHDNGDATTAALAMITVTTTVAATATPQPPTPVPTATQTPTPPTATALPTATMISVLPSDTPTTRPTATSTAIPAATRTPTSQPPTATELPPTHTPTRTPTRQPTPTYTSTKLPPTHTPTPQRIAIPSPEPLLQSGDEHTVRIPNSDVTVTFVFVPGGKFMMGSEDGGSDEKPVHEVFVDDFWMMQTEVSNELYTLFVEADGYTNDVYWQNEAGLAWRKEYGTTGPAPYEQDDFSKPNHPVVGISWYEANAFAAWFWDVTKIEVRLPTEAEWERAARGPHGWKYPWSNEWQDGNANVFGADDGYEFTAPVISFEQGKSFYGALHMAGNVWEWVADYYDSGYYKDTSDNTNNPTGPAEGDRRVVRGGSWYNSPLNVRVSNRGWDNPLGRDFDLGVRLMSPGF